MRHFKRVGLSAATGLAALLVCAHPAAAATGTGNGSNSGREEVFDLVARETQGSRIDEDPSGPSQGDEIISSGNLFFRGSQVGTYGEACTLTRTAPGDEFDLQCVATLSLPPWGQLTAQGRFTITSAGPGDIDFAITGGTGHYRTARGSIHAVNVSSTETNLTVRLIR